jgi:hypothetical protein
MKTMSKRREVVFAIADRGAGGSDGQGNKHQPAAQKSPKIVRAGAEKVMTDAMK